MKKTLIIATLSLSPIMALAQNVSSPVPCPALNPILSQIQTAVSQGNSGRGRELGQQAIHVAAACANTVSNAQIAVAMAQKP